MNLCEGHANLRAISEEALKKLERHLLLECVYCFARNMDLALERMERLADRKSIEILSTPLFTS